MLTRTTETKIALNEILESLSITEEPYYQAYKTSTSEDYKFLLREALSGRLDGIVSVGRSGIYLNELLITPPTDV